MCGSNFSSIKGENNPRSTPRGTQIHTLGSSDLHPGELRFTPRGTQIYTPGNSDLHPVEQIYTPGISDLDPVEQIHTPGNSDLYPGGLNFPHGETILHPGGFNFNPREDIKGFLSYRALLFASQFSGIVLNPTLGKDLKPIPVCKTENY